MTEDELHTLALQFRSHDVAADLTATIERLLTAGLIEIRDDGSLAVSEMGRACLERVGAKIH